MPSAFGRLSACGDDVRYRLPPASATLELWSSHSRMKASN